MSNAEPLSSLWPQVLRVAHVLVGEAVPTSPEHALGEKLPAVAERVRARHPETVRLFL
jgi:hypothetical protein